MRVEISPHARRRLAIRGISEESVLNTLKNPDNTLFDEETGFGNSSENDNKP